MIPPQVVASGGDPRWSLKFDPVTQHYVLTEYAEGTPLRRSSWHTMLEALQHMQARREKK